MPPSGAGCLGAGPGGHARLKANATYGISVQDNLHRMGVTALEAVPEIADITMTCLNKHNLLLNLSPFGLDNNNQVFAATDEPHDQIECAVRR